MANYDNTRYTYAQVLAGLGYYMKDDQLRAATEVKIMQTKLNKVNYNCGTPDGKFGNNTDTAVRAFQRAKGLTVDGKAGKNTLKALDTANILHFGYDETAVTEVKGVKVGLVGIYELNDHLGREEQLKQNIAKVKQDGAQLIVVIFHWGNEKEEVPDENQKTLGHLAIDEGADLVCGHHPHVLQGIEEYKGKNIVYSLGNFCFGGNAYPSDMDTIIFQQTFTIDQNGVKDDNVTNIIPCSISSDSDYNNYQPTPAEGEEATRIMQKIQKRSSWIKDGTVSDSETATESDEEYDENSDAFTDSDDTEDPEA